MKLDWAKMRYILIIISASVIVVTLLFSLSCSINRSSQPSSGTVKPSQTILSDTPPGTVTPLTPSTTSIAPVDVQYTPLPGYSPEPESFVPAADVVVTGQVVESPPQFQQGDAIYRDWTVKIERYIVNPLPLASLKVRILEQSGKMPVKGIHLKQEEHLLLFLKAEGDHYIIAGGLMGAKYTIDGDRVSYGLIGNSPWEPLSEVISRIRRVADTWANERLTGKSKSQLANIATGDPGIKEFLAGKDVQIGEVMPYVVEDALTEIYYIVSINVLKQGKSDVQLAVTVNASRKEVDKIQVNLAYSGYSDEEKSKIQQIALVEPVVRGLIGDRGYKIAEVVRDSWQDNIGGKTVINIFPKIAISLQPAVSNILNVFVDLKEEKVVKIFNESYISPSLLESSESSQDFKLTISIPKANYRVGEIAEAILTLSYNGIQPVQLSSPGGQYLDLLIRDGQNNIVYQWERYNAGLPASLPAPTERVEPPPPGTPVPQHPVKETINPGQSITIRLEFSLPEAGTYYLEGRNFGGWDFGEVLADYPSGSGCGLHIEAPFIVIEVH